jgi:hypothetical protein
VICRQQAQETKLAAATFYLRIKNECKTTCMYVKVDMTVGMQN